MFSWSLGKCSKTNNDEFSVNHKKNPTNYDLSYDHINTKNMCLAWFCIFFKPNKYTMFVNMNKNN